MFDLTGKTALVTGATGGIGAEIARALHAAGAHVVLSGTREAVLADLAAELGGRTSIVVANLSDPAAVDGLIGQAEAAAAAGSAVGVCVVANDNNAGNVVISGSKAAVDLAIEKAKELGARAIPLNVSAPFHCPLMQPAADEMAAALAAAAIQAPRAPLVANVTARPTLDPEVIRRLLVEQVTGRVRWRESLIWLAGEGGVTRFAEAGAGKVLTGMAKRIAPDAESLPLNTPEDLEAFAKGL